MPISLTVKRPTVVDSTWVLVNGAGGTFTDAAIRARNIAKSNFDGLFIARVDGPELEAACLALNVPKLSGLPYQTFIGDAARYLVANFPVQPGEVIA
jgi:hypothetical protein